MKKFSFWMLAAILTFCGATMTLTSCSEKIDTPVVPIDLSQEMTETELQQALVGMHTDISDYVEGGEGLRVWDLRKDNTFTAYDLYYDDELNFTVDTVSGKWRPLLNIDPWWNGAEKMKLQGFTVTYNNEFLPESYNEPQESYFAFLAESDDEDQEDINDALFILDDNAVNTLATLDQEETEENAQARTRAASLGGSSTDAISTLGSCLTDGVKPQQISTKDNLQKFYDATINDLSKAGLKAYFNPNDNGIFTPANWREQKSILLYDRNGSQQRSDGNGSTYHFMQVELPWSNGTVISNLPLNFCDNITPQNGWELVMNNCGRTDVENANYFALYNKFTGTLRFFVFVPQGFTTNDINDHAWEVAMSEELAQHLNMTFSLPMDAKIADKSLIGMYGSDYTMLTSPWISNKSDDGLTTPSPGWWAFDIDLSLYRKNSSPVGQKIRLQMEGWKKSQVSLSSTIKAQIQEMEYPETFGFNTVTGLFGKGKKAYEVYKEFDEKFDGLGFLEKIGALSNLISTGLNVVKGISGAVKIAGASGEPELKTKQYINGTIDTKGLISSSTAITNMYAPTFELNRFETTKSTLGQGVWNLKHAPIVYQGNICFYDEHTHWVDAVTHSYAGTSQAAICLFDPTSVEVELNPNVFRDQTIESIQVASLCGVRKGVKHYENDEYRKAFGLEVNKVVTPMATKQMNFNTAIDDYLYESQSKTGSVVQYEKYESKNNTKFDLRGRGNIDGKDNYVIEPMLLAYIYGDHQYKIPDEDMILPCYEVTVTVTIKLQGYDKPLVYTRRYLPEIKKLVFDDAKSIYSKMQEKLEQVKKDPIQQKSAPLLEYQVNHFKEKCMLVRPNFDAMELFYYKNAHFANEDYDTHTEYLFDGDYTTEVAIHYGRRENGMWKLTFETSRPITPKQYKLVTAPKASHYAGESNPKEWALFGQNSSGAWVELDRRNAGGIAEDRLPIDDSVGKNYTLNRNHGTFQKFMFIVYSFFGYDSYWEGFTRKSPALRLAELQLSELEPVVFTFERSTGGEPGGYEGKNLIDDDHVSEWHCPNKGEDDRWFVEFKANRPISPTSYYFITGNDSYEHWDRTPQCWALYGKQNKDDRWTELSHLDRNYNGDEAAVPGANRQKSAVFRFNMYKPENMQYFRLEIIRNFGSSAVQLNELIFNY